MLENTSTSGTFKRFKNTEAAIYELQVTDEQYKKIQTIIYSMQSNKNKYKFNTLGLAFVMINKKRKKENKFYCAEFVKYVLEQSGINVENLPEIIKPEDFKKLPNLNNIYVGKLKEYKGEIIEK